MQLQRQSVALYEELARVTGEDFELVMDGRLRLAITEDEVRSFESLVQRSQHEGVEGHMLLGADIQRHEPALSDRVLGAAWFPRDGKVPVSYTHLRAHETV